MAGADAGKQVPDGIRRLLQGDVCVPGVGIVRVPGRQAARDGGLLDIRFLMDMEIRQSFVVPN